VSAGLKVRCALPPQDVHAFSTLLNEVLRKQICDASGKAKCPKQVMSKVVFPDICAFLFFFWCLGQGLAMWPRLASNSQFSYLSAGITGVYQHALPGIHSLSNSPKPSVHMQHLKNMDIWFPGPSRLEPALQNQPNVKT
jgi:hypothetical protein